MTNSNNIFHPRKSKPSSSGVRRTTSGVKKPTKQDNTPAPRPVVKIQSPPPGADKNREFVEQLVRENALLAKENKLLKSLVVKMEAKLNSVKDVAVSIANFGRRNNSADRGMLMDWASKIMNTINQK